MQLFNKIVGTAVQNLASHKEVCDIDSDEGMPKYLHYLLGRRKILRLYWLTPL